MEITGGEGIKAVIDGSVSPRGRPPSRCSPGAASSSLRKRLRRGARVLAQVHQQVRFPHEAQTQRHTVTREELLPGQTISRVDQQRRPQGGGTGRRKEKQKPPFPSLVARLTRAVADETNPRLQSWSPHAHRPHIKQSFEAPREARVLDESALGSRRRSPEKDPAPLTAAPNPEPKRPVRPRRSTGASPWSRPWRVTITSRLVSLAARFSTRSDRRDIENDRLFARRSPRDSALRRCQGDADVILRSPHRSPAFSYGCLHHFVSLQSPRGEHRTIARPSRFSCDAPPAALP